MLEFDSRTGYLPEGVHHLDPSAFCNAFGWNGRRRFLLAGLGAALANLKAAGCRAVIVDGSFVTAKEHPGDWDAAFDPVGVMVKRLDPVLIKHDDGRHAMRAKYLGDMFPWTDRASASGDSVYRQFFQTDRNGQPKGIVEIQLQVLQ